MLQTVKDYMNWHSQEFYPFYLAEHQHPQSRKLHYIGTSIGLAGVALATVTGSLPLLVLGVGAAYGVAFSGHTKFENNKPATFKMPFASVLADVRMLGSYLNGTIEEKFLQLGLDSTGTNPVLKNVLPFSAWRYKSVIQPDKIEGLKIQPQRGEVFGGEFMAKMHELTLKAGFNKVARVFETRHSAPAPQQPVAQTEVKPMELPKAVPLPPPQI